MTKAKRLNPPLALALTVLGLAFSIIPPLVCTLSYFPLWKSVGYETCIAGGGALLLILCFIPLFKLVRRAFMSYSSYFVWLFLFLIFFALSRIADQMTVISLVGLVGNLIGGVFFAIAKKYKKED